MRLIAFDQGNFGTRDRKVSREVIYPDSVK